MLKFKYIFSPYKMSKLFLKDKGLIILFISNFKFLVCFIFNKLLFFAYFISYF